MTLVEIIWIIIGIKIIALIYNLCSKKPRQKGYENKDIALRMGGGILINVGVMLILYGLVINQGQEVMLNALIKTSSGTGYIVFGISLIGSGILCHVLDHKMKHRC